jgi:hypothetical protein
MVFFDIFSLTFLDGMHRTKKKNNTNKDFDPVFLVRGLATNEFIK